MFFFLYVNLGIEFLLIPPYPIAPDLKSFQAYDMYRLYAGKHDCTTISFPACSVVDNKLL